MKDTLIKLHDFAIENNLLYDAQPGRKQSMYGYTVLISTQDQLKRKKTNSVVLEFDLKR